MSRPVEKALSRRKLEVLRALQLHPDASWRKLAETLECSHPNVIQLVQALRASGHVLRSSRALSAKGTVALASAIADLQSALASVA